MNIVWLIVGIAIGSLVCLLFRNQIKKQITQQLGQAKQQADELEKANIESQNAQKELEKKLISMEQYYHDLEANKESAKQQASENTKLYLQTQLQLAGESFEEETHKMAEKYTEMKDEYEQEYLNTLSESAEKMRQWLLEQKLSKEEMEKTMSELSSKVSSAIEAAKREEEKKNAVNFYRLNLSKEDLDEIEKLRSIEKYLRNKEALNKVIYKIYYEKPYTDLVGRVIGSGIHCGIYKITNIKNQMCYVGQSNNIAERWKQHIKRAVGAETPTNNKLYPAMQEYGIENFTFEIIEECDKEYLNQHELYWQDFFGAKEFGYSIK